MSSRSTATAPSRSPCAATVLAEIGEGQVPYGRTLGTSEDISAANQAERHGLRLSLAEGDARGARRQRLEQLGIGTRHAPSVVGQAFYRTYAVQAINRR